jgi:hypothetical protein
MFFFHPIVQTGQSVTRWFQVMDALSVRLQVGVISVPNAIRSATSSAIFTGAKSWLMELSSLWVTPYCRSFPQVQFLAYRYGTFIGSLNLTLGNVGESKYVTMPDWGPVEYVRMYAFGGCVAV